MKYTLIGDSICDLHARNFCTARVDFHVVPLTMYVGDQEFVDSDELDTAMLMQKIDETKACPKTACPSPEAFYEIMAKGDNIVVITVSSKLSATHSAASQAAERITREQPNKKVFVLDSRTAAAGCDYLLIQARDLMDAGTPFDELTTRITQIRDKMRTRFLVHDLSSLVKNGRMSKMAGKMLSTIKLKVIGGDDGEGEIKKHGVAIGTKRALVAISQMPVTDKHPQDGLIVIAHNHNIEDMGFLKGLLEKFGFNNIKTFLTRGASSIYTAEKGVVIAY